MVNISKIIDQVGHLDVVEIQPLVDVLVNLPHHTDVVTTHYVQT